MRAGLTATLLALFGASAMCAEQVPRQADRRIEQRFRQLDRNADGQVTRQEVGGARWLGRMDRDGDGVVTLEEAQQYVSDPSSTGEPATATTGDFRKWFGDLDKNGDRFIEANEADAKTIRGADRNADGRVSVREARRYHRDLLAKEAAKANPSIYEPWTRTRDQKPLRTAQSGDPLLNLRFTRDLPTGESDRNGALITGTECMHLETHRGMLFATLSGWNHDRTRAPWPGPSIVVKRSAADPWEVEANFGQEGGRAGSLCSVTFTTDANGQTLDPPVAILLCGVGGLLDPGKVLVWARDDATGKWVKTVAGLHPGPGSPEVRVIFGHLDGITGVHHVFAAASNGMLYRGAYAPGAPGRVAWETTAEWSGRERRFMAAAEAGGSVYLTVDLEPTKPENGGLFRRVDGPEPTWERVTGWTWSHPNPDTQRPWFGMRGLPALPDGTLLGAREHPGAIDRIDPRLPEGERRGVEFDVRSALMDLWQIPDDGRGGMALIAYNDMLPVRHPLNGELVHLIALGTRHPGGGTFRNPNQMGASAWYLVRYGAGDYGLGRVFDPAHPIPNRESGGLRATRTIRPSPFPEEAGRVWYFAGFDAFGGPSHLNTAWIYRGELPDQTAHDEATAQSARGPGAPVATGRIATSMDVEYGVHDAQRLDIYAPKNAEGLPVMVYIHGGGWRRGDKSAVGQKAEFFTNLGWVFVSMNYQLLPEGKHPANVQDVARALAWVRDHVAEHGGDPDQIFLMGHSAGAHLAALVATDGRHLQAVGEDLSILKGVVALDTNTYDLPTLMQSRAAAFYGQIFGDDPEVWRDATPVTHVAAGKGIPPFLICYSRGMREQSNPTRKAQAEAFASKLRAARIPAEVVDASDRSHGEINAWFGDEGDVKVTGRAIAFLTRESEDRAATGIRFTRDYEPGTRDRKGQFMGGVELMRLVSHGGSLFAALGYATDLPGDDPSPGAQILVKRGPDEPWEVEQNFPGALRVNAMESVTFRTDYTGQALAAPVVLLVAEASSAFALRRESSPLSCVVRDDSSGRWEECPISTRAPRAYVRAFGVHRDRRTGVDRIFAGTGAGEIYSGAYDPDSPGGIRWDAEPEYTNPNFEGGSFKRVSAFCEANGEAYCSVAPRLVRRIDGAQPAWEEVFTWDVDEGKYGAGLRGITAVRMPGEDHEVIVGSRERPGRILRIDPKDGFRVEVELDSRAFLRQQWGVRPIGGGLTAYNRFVPGRHPGSGEPVHWVTVAAIRPGDMNAAWLIIRNADASYEVVRIFDSSLRDHPRLISTRTVEIAPWSDSEIYTGGYDLWGNNRRNHNTAWIYRGTLQGGDSR